MNKRNAFSLVELLVTFAILAVVLTLVSVTFRNIRQNAQQVAIDRDQTSFVQFVEAFKGTGGSIAPIASLSLEDQAAALTALLSSDTSAESRTKRGTVANLIDSGMVVIPVRASANDTATRLVLRTNGQLSMAKSGDGFRIVSRSTLGSVPAASSTAISAAASARATDSGGSNYASDVAYVRPKDESAIGGPDSIPTPVAGSGAPGGTAVSLSPLDVAYSGIQGYTFAQYSGARAEIFLYRNDNTTPLAASDLQNIRLSFGGVAVGAPVGLVTRYVSGSSIVGGSGGTSRIGYYWSLDLNTLRPAIGWTSSSQPIVVAAEPTAQGQARGITSGISRTLVINALKTRLAPPAPTAANATMTQMGSSSWNAQLGPYGSSTWLRFSLPSGIASSIADVQLSWDSATSGNSSYAPGTGIFTSTPTQGSEVTLTRSRQAPL